MEALLEQAEVCAAFYGASEAPKRVPEFLVRARQAVVLAKSSDYHYYHLSDYPDFRLVICGLHDSYIHLPVWEMRTNKRYKARETAVAITSPTFERLRCTQFGHNILLGALIEGNQDALTFTKTLPLRTQNRLEHEKEDIQARRYQVDRWRFSRMQSGTKLAKRSVQASSATMNTSAYESCNAEGIPYLVCLPV
ncbi:hypothetical protein KSD_39130 [Ktedonobacter sp. SOSP1-85]|uniref:hypothetical protein n=1 Tax=Ktedonobacter sp. SOSP1-85 TaxID=2778367 RepID=UPI0019160A7B|nr:hypothetical protein [Ktedonobacter sp. SOSP1-85]GHO76142.1 hypothetical protein KSD_39130 [Ktedonobacter sp. SOSP1-85]